MASTDTDGVAKLWDVRMAGEMASISTCGGPANSCAFDRSGKLLLIASSSGAVLCFNVTTLGMVAAFPGHQGPTHGVGFDANCAYFVSSGADQTCRYWASKLS